MEPIAPTTAAQNLWAEKLAGTWTDPVTGLVLALSSEDSALHSRALAMLVSSKKPANWKIKKADKTKTELSAKDAEELLSRYVTAWLALFDEFAP